MLLWKRVQVKAFRPKGQGKNRKKAVPVSEGLWYDTGKTSRPADGEREKKMTEKPFHFPTYLREETEKVRESYYPVRVPLVTRLTKKKEKPGKLHPNPDDEFCYPDIGPNYSIIAKYEAAYRDIMAAGSAQYDTTGADEPIMVQKARPDGFLIMNGHHRWAAALKMKVPKVKIKIVNLTQISDIRDMLARSRSDRRVTVDLDEVVFAREEDRVPLEKPMPFPLNRFFRERVRRGIPTLFHTLSAKGYDIWIYTSGYYSMDYIHHYFRVWNLKLTGVVTGAGRKNVRRPSDDREMKQMMDTKYRSTLHIDRDLVLRTFSGSKECDEFPLSGNPETWVREVTDAVEKMAKADEKKALEDSANPKPQA